LAAQKAVSVNPKPAPNPGYVELQGFVYPIRRFTLKLRPGERVDAVMVAKGDHVKAGQPLARIADTALQSRYLELMARKNDYQMLRDDIDAQTLEISQHRAAAQRIQARIDNLQKLKDTFPDYPIDKEAEPLIDQKFELEDQIATGSARLTRLQARLDSQQAMAKIIDRELDAARTRLDRESIAAPFAGTVVDRANDIDRLAPEDVVCDLWDESGFRIDVEILQYQLPYVQPGRTAIIAVDFARGETVQGIVDSVEPGNLTPDASGHPKFKAIVKLEKPVSWLRPGMQVAVRVRSEGAK
jgi:multidrug resistance efflux pump